jgi:hypothetical protein
MGNKHAHRLLTGTSFHATETDRDRAKVCAKMFKTYKKSLNTKQVEDISAEELLELLGLREDDDADDDQEEARQQHDDSEQTTTAAAATPTPEIVLVDCRDDFERSVSSIPVSLMSDVFLSVRQQVH